MQTALVPCDRKFFCKSNLSFFKAVPPTTLRFYSGSLFDIISSLISHFCLFENAILHKTLKPWFGNFKSNFHRMQFPLVATFLSLVLDLSSFAF